ncbi:hypothetical protein BTA35_0216810, partial [Oceanospirillum linum]
MVELVVAVSAMVAPLMELAVVAVRFVVPPVKLTAAVVVPVMPDALTRILFAPKTESFAAGGVWVSSNTDPAVAAACN